LILGRHEKGVERFLARKTFCVALKPRRLFILPRCKTKQKITAVEESGNLLCMNAKFGRVISENFRSFPVSLGIHFKQNTVSSNAEFDFKKGVEFNIHKEIQ